MKTRSRTMFVVTAWIAVIGIQETRAHSLALENVTELPALVTMIDGTDQNGSVTLRYDVVGKNSKGAGNGKSGKNNKHKSDYLFGYYDAGEFSPLSGKKGTVEFASGSGVDFAIAGKGSDGLFGTSDDVYYRLSDAADYADLFFRRPAGNGKSHTPDNSFGKLMIVWDTDFDGKADFRVHLRAGSHYDGMAVAAVPIPAAGLLFASGLVGLGMVRWRRRERV